MEIKLKPCPFCGSKAELLIVPGKMTKWAVRCTKCYANNGTFVSDHDAVEAWNKRAEPDRNVEKCGKWKTDIRCSVCGKSFTVDAYRWCDIGFTESDLNYCPNCGAKMDEEASE